MSSSDPRDTQRTPSGRPVQVIMGAEVRTLAGAPARRETPASPAWDPAEEADYLARVKARAADKAREMLAQARADATRLHDEARQQGYEAGLAQAQQELSHAHAEMAHSLAQTLASICEGSLAVWQVYRQDLILLTRFAVEKILGVELGENRRQVLESLLDEAAARLEAAQGLTLRVSTEDRETMEQILQSFTEHYPKLQQWSVKTDAAMAPGGVVVESDAGLVDNSLESRMALVEEVLNQLSLPETDLEAQTREDAARHAAAASSIEAELAQQQAPQQDPAAAAAAEEPTP